MHYLAGLLRYEGTVTCIIVYTKKKFPSLHNVLSI